MAKVEFRNVTKVFEGGVKAVDDFSLELADGELVVLVGPSGCGKSTFLRLVAGLEPLSSGQILADGQPLHNLLPQERNVAMVFQNYALYPHKTVRRNLEFPLRMMKLDKAEIHKRVREISSLLGLNELLERKPGQLSGGQQQRVAMGRALVRDPRLFLMDEPLSNLDAKLRVEIRGQIAELQRRVGVTTLYVTHDQTEAMTLGDRVAVLLKGRLQQVATAKEIYRRPANVFVATFIGSPRMNIFRTKLAKDGNGRYLIRFGRQEWPVPPERVEKYPKLAEYVGRTLLAGLRPEAFHRPGSDEGATTVSLKVYAAEALGHELIIYFESPVPMVSDQFESQGTGRPADRPENTQSVQSQDAEDSFQPQGRLIARIPVDAVPQRGDSLKLSADLSGLFFFDKNGRALGS